MLATFLLKSFFISAFFEEPSAVFPILCPWRNAQNSSCPKEPLPVKAKTEKRSSWQHTETAPVLPIAGQNFLLYF
jgi:hypothetical protein